MKTGVPPTDLNARTGELTPPGIDCWARSKSSALRVVFINALQRANELSGALCVIGENDRCAGALDRSERFEHHTLFVDPSSFGSGLDHRIFTTHLIGRCGHI